MGTAAREHASLGCVLGFWDWDADVLLKCSLQQARASQCPPRVRQPPLCIRAIRGSRQRGAPTREQCVGLAPRTDDHLGRCMRASAKTGSTLSSSLHERT